MAFKKSSGKKLTYTRRTYEATKKRAEQSGGLRDQYLKDHVPMWKPADGENCIRILPPTWEDPQHYGIDVFVHYGIGPDNSAFLDLNRMKGEPDPISEAYDRAVAEGDEDYAKSLRSVKRVLVYLIDRDKPKDGPQMWAMPWTVDKDINTQSIDSRTREILYIDDPDEGYDVFINREGQGERTKYSVKIARNPSAVELEDSWIELLEQNPLPDCLNFFEYDHIKKVFTGKSDSGKNEKPSTRDVKKPAKKTPELPTWDEVHEMEIEALEEVIETFGLELDPEDFSDEGELADSICETLEIKKPSKRPAKAEESKPAKVVKKPEPEPEAEEEEEEEAPPEPEKKSSIRDRLAKLRPHS